MPIYFDHRVDHRQPGLGPSYEAFRGGRPRRRDVSEADDQFNSRVLAMCGGGATWQWGLAWSSSLARQAGHQVWGNHEGKQLTYSIL
jgi:hypothetical protein